MCKYIYIYSVYIQYMYLYIYSMSMWVDHWVLQIPIFAIGLVCAGGWSDLTTQLHFWCSECKGISRIAQGQRPSSCTEHKNNSPHSPAGRAGKRILVTWVRVGSLSELSWLSLYLNCEEDISVTVSSLEAQTTYLQPRGRLYDPAACHAFWRQSHAQVHRKRPCLLSCQLHSSTVVDCSIFQCYKLWQMLSKKWCGGALTAFLQGGYMRFIF